MKNILIVSGIAFLILGFVFVLVMHPWQKTPNIGNGLEKSDLIRANNLLSNQTITSPLAITGEARGTWFFEASFPVKLLDGNGNLIVEVPAQAQGEWMTTEFVPFKTMLVFAKPATPTGTLVFEKANPSGLPENADELRIPIKFETGGSGDTGKCIVTGCSGQICSDKEVISTCEYTEEYACYKTAVCERQVSGDCGWTQTPELEQCIIHARTGDSGVKGRVLLGPTCPVVREPPDPQCADKPYQTKITGFKKGTSIVVATTESAANGIFQFLLPPGVYTIVPRGGQIFPSCAPQDVTVVEGQLSDIAISCDTGIR